MAKRQALTVQRGRLTPARDTVAQDLGWFSIGLGLAELLAPRAVGAMVGMRRTAPLISLYGVREIATGVGILAAPDPTPFVWGRVAGDALDAATLTLGLVGRRGRGRALLALLAVGGVAALDVLCAQSLSSRAAQRPGRRFDYEDRSGWPRPPEMMRGAARPTPSAAQPHAAPQDVAPRTEPSPPPGGSRPVVLS
ncbi:MAG: cyclase dehydrase [Rhodospirillales bacterium]|nr:cyclase dehydrase [Rhodospirillales bacterium]